MLHLDADSATAGLIMNFVLQLSGSLSVTAVVGTQLESEMVSIRRILEYCDIKPEGTCGKPRSYPPAAWPTRGEIEFDNVTATYDSENLPVLQNVSVAIPSGQKVGVVGRSGAGKSSFGLAILGLLELDSSCIRIDNLDISRCTLDELRKRITTIPQEPTAFSGTVRDNLDPNQEFDITDLVKAIEESNFSSGFPDPYAALEFELTERR